MADFLRELDPAHRAFLAVFLAVLLKAFLSFQWHRFKAKQAAKPAQMAMRGGVYVAWGPVERIEAAGRFILKGWLVWMLVVLAALGYMHFMGWERLF